MRTRAVEWIIIAVLSLSIAAGVVLLPISYFSRLNFKPISVVDLYQELLSGHKKEIEPLIPLEIYPKIKGYKLIDSVLGFEFDNAQPMGEYLYLQIGDKHFLTDGQEYFDFSDSYDLINNRLNFKLGLLNNQSVKDGRYVYVSGVFDSLNNSDNSDGSDGFIGLKKVSGEIIIEPADYDSIEFWGDTAIAKKDGLQYVYYKDKRVGETTKDVYFSSRQHFILVDGSYFDVSASDFYVNFSLNKPILLHDIIPSAPTNYALMSPPEGVFLICDTQAALFGYADADTGQILIKPRFRNPDEFENGCVMVFDPADGCDYYLKYFDGSLEIFNLKDFGLDCRDQLGNEKIRIAPFYNGYAVYFDVEAEMYGVLDGSFNIVSDFPFKNLYPKVLAGKAPAVLDLITNCIFALDGSLIAGIIGGNAKNEMYFAGISNTFGFADAIYYIYILCNSGTVAETVVDNENCIAWSVLDSDLEILQTEFAKDEFISQYELAYYFENSGVLLICHDSTLYFFERKV